MLPSPMAEPAMARMAAPRPPNNSRFLSIG